MRTQRIEHEIDECAQAVGLIAPSTGAALFHEPVNPLVFNVRSKFQTEVEKVIEHLASGGIKQIGVVYANNSFGKDGVEAFNRKMNALQLKPVMVIPFDRAASDLVVRTRKTGSAVQFVTIWAASWCLTGRRITLAWHTSK